MLENNILASLKCPFRRLSVLQWGGYLELQPSLGQALAWEPEGVGRGAERGWKATRFNSKLCRGQAEREVRTLTRNVHSQNRGGQRDIVGVCKFEKGRITESTQQYWGHVSGPRIEDLSN